MNTENQKIVQRVNFVSLVQAQEIFGVSRSFLYQLKGKDKLQFYYVESKPFIKISEFESLMTIEE